MKTNNELKNIWDMLIKRDFKGLKGMAVKNSIYQFLISVAAKSGGFIFTIILARMLMPDVFGLYSLALSTIMIFNALSDLGTNNSLLNFLSKEYGKKDGNTLGYRDYIFKIIFVLNIIIAVSLIGSAYFISNFYYRKPIFLALIGGAIYILSTTFFSYVSNILMAQGRFKEIFYREVFFQIIRIIILPILVLILLHYSSDILLFGIFSMLTLTYFFSCFYLWNRIPKKEGRYLTKEEKKEVNKFILALSTTALGGIIFAYADIVIIGRYVSSSMVGYYQIALTLAGTLSSFLVLSAVFLPIFKNVYGENLERIFKKVLKMNLIISILFFFFVNIIAYYAVWIIYGTSYLSVVNILRILSITLVTEPIAGILSSYYIANNKQNFLAKAFTIVALINAVLIFLLVHFFVGYSQYSVLLATAGSVVVCRIIYLAILFFNRKVFKVK